MSPENSSVHSEEELFNIMENEMAVHSRSNSDVKYVIAGDFNAYTQCQDDFLRNDSLSCWFDQVPDISDEVPEPRHNLDLRELNLYGRQLLDFCKSTGVRILNGRCGQDRNVDNYTCIMENSYSVIDYVMVSQEILSYVTKFKVGERIESIHMPHVYYYWYTFRI